MNDSRRNFIKTSLAAFGLGAIGLSKTAYGGNPQGGSDSQGSTTAKLAPKVFDLIERTWPDPPNHTPDSTIGYLKLDLPDITYGYVVARRLDKKNVNPRECLYINIKSGFNREAEKTIDEALRSQKHIDYYINEYLSDKISVLAITDYGADGLTHTPTYRSDSGNMRSDQIIVHVGHHIYYSLDVDTSEFDKEFIQRVDQLIYARILGAIRRPLEEGRCTNEIKGALCSPIDRASIENNKQFIQDNMFTLFK